MNLNITTSSSLFDTETLGKMAETSRQLASELSFRIQGTEEFTDALSDFGCVIDGEQVDLPRTVIDRVFDRMGFEKEKRPHEGDEAVTTKNEKPESEGVTLFTHGQALHACDATSNELRPATTGDLESWCHLVDALGISERSHPTFIPQDVPTAAASFHTFATIILNSRKPHRVSVFSKQMLPFFIEAWKLAEDPDGRTDPAFATKCWVNSPFMITRENIEIAMDARRLLGRRFEFGVMPVAGASTPVTVAGALVQNTAESIALSAFSLALDDTLTPLSPTAAILDMSAATQRQSGPDLMLHSVAASEMHEFLTGTKNRPFCHTGVSAKVVSPQSLYEKAFTASMAIAMDSRSLGIGCLAYSDVGSPVQLVLDTQMGEHLSQHFRPVAVDDDHIGLDEIRRVVPTGSRYMESEHTAKYFREELWMQNYIDHRPVLTWVNDPTDMIANAQRRALDLLQSAENLCPLPATNRTAIEELMREADKVAAAGSR